MSCFNALGTQLTLQGEIKVGTVDTKKQLWPALEHMLPDRSTNRQQFRESLQGLDKTKNGQPLHEMRGEPWAAVLAPGR